ncbi:MAG: N-6 DNA methylase [Nitrospirota bacterium]
MLDNVTKRRIDTARDILVGKVPDPKSQVEQITIALIYKFMDDMDAQAEEMGGKPSFFSGEYEKYGWAKLMSLGKGGHEVLNLYGEAITTMNLNEGIPPLFRDIFKNAYLPYRDPETLKSFLKIINDFEYDHSERLGDAFEYLLSVLGSQGDAGQFRTPRHIIDFMVEVIDPKKDESILDPACGTAGFLISSWKHVLQANSKGGRKGAGLTPDERKRLTKNIKGYDISPDMVRLSLVNLYLHGFTDPHISEYDTLTSEDNWNQYSDIIMANPPFMSPKGGIKPHKRFSVQAKRSEVLFVDYIAEHLTPNGRAAVIVPEGIIFQSQNAYKQLRQMLVENYLYAVVSLPAGVFQPYSGVKTSILLMDKTLAKKCDSILFVKIENDGFDLGAQRREIQKNDLPDAKQALHAFHQACISGEVEVFNAEQFANVLRVEKEKIGENEEWNLSGERYRENDELKRSNYKLYKLNEITEIKKGSTITKKTAINGEIPVIAGGQYPAYYHKTSNREGRSITVSSSGAYAGFINYFEQPIFASDCTTIQSDENKLNTKFLYHLLKLKQEDFYRLQKGGAQPHVYGKDFGELKIPLPPLKIQLEIVAEIEGYQKIIDGARAVVENYKPYISIQPDWPIVELREVLDVKPKNGYSGSPVPYETSLKVLSLSATTSGSLNTKQFKYLDEDISENADCRCRKGDIYLQRGNTKELVGTAALFDLDSSDFIYPDLMIRIRANKKKILTKYLLHVLQSLSVREFITANAVGAAGSMPKINQGIVLRIPTPLPSLEAQQHIVEEIEKEQAMVTANKELITLFEQKIKDKIASVWGE